MCTIFELLLFMSGLYALITAKVPTLIAGANFRIEGNGARWVGAVLALPLPLAFLTGFVMAFFLGRQAVSVATIAEVLIDIISLVAATILLRRFRQPITGSAVNIDRESPAAIEAIIAHKTNGSLIYALIGLLGFTAIVVGPLVVIRTTKALRLIDQYHVGEQYRNRAKLTRILAVGICTFYGCIALALIVPALIVGR